MQTEPKIRMVDNKPRREDEIFMITAEQLKFWMSQDVSPQEAMESLGIRANKVTGAGWKKADWMDVGVSLVKIWADH